MNESSESNNLWLFLEAVARRRALMITIVVVATVAAVIISLLLPKWYRASALLLPPKEVTVNVGGASQLAEVASVIEGLNLPVMVTASDVFARMLRSRTVAEHVIDSFDLARHYKTESFTDTYLALMSHSRFTVTEEGLLDVSVEDRDPKTAAEIANAFVQELDLVNRRIASRRAVQNRQFIEERVRQVKAQLDTARQSFENFQVKHRAVDFDEQTRLAIEQAISLKVSLAQLEIDIRMNEKVLGKDNPEMIEKRRRRDIIKQQLEQLESGGSDSSFFSLPLAAVPTLKGQYEVLYSRVKVNEQLYTILLEQLERAKLQENEELPTLTVLDYARPPEVRDRPRRSVIVLASFGGSILVAVFLALILEYFRRLREQNPEDYTRANYVLRSFFGWLPGVHGRNHPEKK